MCEINFIVEILLTIESNDLHNGVYWAYTMNGLSQLLYLYTSP